MTSGKTKWQRRLRGDNEMSTTNNNTTNGKMLYLYQKSVNAINLLQFLLGKSFSDGFSFFYMCVDIERFIQKRQDFPFNKTNKITPTTHKSTFWYFIIVTMSRTIWYLFIVTWHIYTTEAAATPKLFLMYNNLCARLFNAFRSVM